MSNIQDPQHPNKSPFDPTLLQQVRDTIGKCLFSNQAELDRALAACYPNGFHDESVVGSTDLGMLLVHLSDVIGKGLYPENYSRIPDCALEEIHDLEREILAEIEESNERDRRGKEAR